MEDQAQTVSPVQYEIMDEPGPYGEVTPFQSAGLGTCTRYLDTPTPTLSNRIAPHVAGLF